MAQTQYRGVSFPFRRGPQAFPVPASNADLIQQSLVQIIGTKKGEWVYRPDYGSDIITYLFENNNDLLAELVSADVFVAIGKYEPRVIVNDVKVTRDAEAVTVDVVYTIIATGTLDTVQVVFGA